MSRRNPENSVQPLSVIVLTYNEEANLPDCLASLEGLQCQVFVVDSGSTDRTVEIAQAAGAMVTVHPFENYSLQRNWAQQNLPIESEWVLHLDADECLTPEIVREINEVFQEPLNGVDGFLLCRRTFFMGRWIRHGGHYPSYHLRLFRKERGFCEDRLYDQHFLVNGQVKQLTHDFSNFLTSDLNTWLARHTRWAELEAQEILSPRNGGSRVRASLLGNSIERRRWLREAPYAFMPLYVRAFLYWFYRYILRLGFLDGKAGLIFHFLQGCWYRFLIDCKLDELKQRNPGHARDPHPRVESFETKKPAGTFTHRPTPRRKRLLFWGAGFLAVLVLATVFYASFLRLFAKFLVAEDALEPAAAIIVLGGDLPFRAMEAAELYRAGWARQLVLVRGPNWERQQALRDFGVPYPREWEVSREVLLRLGVPPGAILAPQEAAAGTLEELRIVADALSPPKGPVILVTSKAHTRRVGLTWRYVVGSQWHGIVRAARKDPFDPDRWWQQRRFALELVREYLGLMNYWAGFPVGAPIPKARSAQ